MPFSGVGKKYGKKNTGFTEKKPVRRQDFLLSPIAILRGAIWQIAHFFQFFPRAVSRKKAFFSPKSHVYRRAEAEKKKKKVRGISELSLMGRSRIGWVGLSGLSSF